MKPYSRKIDFDSCNDNHVKSISIHGNDNYLK